MDKIVRGACIALLVASAGCSQHSDSPYRVVPPDTGNGAPGDASGPTAEPPSAIDCHTLSFPATGDFDALPGGIWRGTLVDCEYAAGTEYVTAIVSEDGRFRIVGNSGHHLAGSLATDGDRFDGFGFDFAPNGVEYFSGPATGMFVSGTVRERSLMEGRWGTEWGSYGYFSLDFQPDVYQVPTSLEDLADVWPTYAGESVEGVWTVEPDGRFFGQDDSGCLQAGAFSLVDDRFSVFAVEVEVTGCDQAGTYNGLAYREEPIDLWDASITVSVDDGERTLRIVLLQ